MSLLETAAGESYSGKSERNPFLNKVSDTPRGAYHGTIKTAILKNGEAEPDKEYGIVEVQFPNGQVRVALEQINRPGHAGKFARGRLRAALVGAMGEEDPDDYTAFLRRVLTDQDGEIKGKPVTLIVTEGGDPRYNSIEWLPGHRSDVTVQEMPPKGANAAPPPVPAETGVKPEDKAKAAGYLPNGDSGWWYHPSTKDQKKLSAFA